ncbi:pentatricopeptide repeat-containing protein At4g16390, chloroplastic-like [Lotus japonicus]|uniref:pentatricopeptide repeat-containing protein At4g16390, chloroplastic-like n=1 Tax=Lotus japonicus TaxID=34305 RepID=UPI00258AC272|nr:pentatricopeptide repeat-containing protein At4g16390, chloroplastic-like [Lotus japonicus]
MAQPQAHTLCSSPYSGFHDCKPMTTLTIPSPYSFRSLKLPNFPSSHKLSLLPLQSKTFLQPTLFSLQHSTPPALNSLEDAKLDDPDAKSSKFHVRVKPRTPRTKQLRKKTSDTSSSILKLAKSLDSCDPSEQKVSEVLKGFGDNVTEREAELILHNMESPETALPAVEYLQQKIEPARQVVLYNATLKLCKEIRDFERAEKVFDEMLQRGVEPNLVTFSTMISCASMCSLPHKSVEWFEKMLSFECEPDDNVYSDVIYAYALTCNVDMALSLYDRARKEKWRIDTLAFAALVKMYGMVGNYDGCLSVYNEMKVLGPKPNRVTYNNLLYALGRAKRGWQAKAIYNEMISCGYSPDWSTYSVLLQAYCRARFGEDALGVYREMKAKGMDLDVVLYGMLLDMCADIGYMDEAIQIFIEMKSSPTCQPDSFIYSSLINMYSCKGKVSEAEAMLNEMIRGGFEPNILVLTSLVHCYGKAKRTDDIVRILNQLLDLGISPDDRFFDCLLAVMTQLPKHEIGKIAECLEKVNPKLGSVVRYLTEEWEGDGNFRNVALELFDSMDHHRVKKSFCNYIIDLCVNLDVPDRARDLLNLGLKLEIYTEIQSRSQTRWCLHLKKLSLGSALTALHVWISDLSTALESGQEIPPLLGIYLGLGKHKSSDKDLGIVLESHLKLLNAPFHKANDMAGWFLTTNEEAKSWLQCRGSTESVAALKGFR